jgi:hypothetical protein
LKVKELLGPTFRVPLLPRDHYRSIGRTGLIRLTDASATQFYYTLPGAAKTATWTYLVGVIRGLSQGSFPRSA